MLCLTQEACNKFMGIIRHVGLLLTDPRYMTPTLKVDARQREIPMYETVMEKIGKPESIMKSLEAHIPSEFLDMNRQALKL